MKEYIYALICPIENVVRYVGKTKNVKNRYKQHIKKLDKQMTLKRRWLEMLFSKKLLPLVEILEVCGSEAREREQYYVSKYIDTTLNIHNPQKGAKSIKGRYPKRRAGNG